MRQGLVRYHQQPGQSKIRDLDIALVINQDILWFQVSVKYLFLVTVFNACQYFLDDGLGLLFVDRVGFGVDEFLKVELEELKDNFEVLVGGFIDYLMVRKKGT